MQNGWKIGVQKADINRTTKPSKRSLFSMQAMKYMKAGKPGQFMCFQETGVEMRIKSYFNHFQSQSFQFHKFLVLLSSFFLEFLNSSPFPSLEQLFPPSDFLMIFSLVFVYLHWAMPSFQPKISGETLGSFKRKNFDLDFAVRVGEVARISVT